MMLNDLTLTLTVTLTSRTMQAVAGARCMSARQGGEATSERSIPRAKTLEMVTAVNLKSAFARWH
jgi:hypothetical protein